MSSLYPAFNRQKFSTSCGASWSVTIGSSSNPVTYNTYWNFMGNPSYSSTASGGGGLATWLPQSPNGLVWNANGQLSIPISGRWALSMVVTGAVLGGNNTQYCISLLTAPANAQYGTTSISNSAAPATILATGSFSTSGEQNVSLVVPLVAGSVLSTCLYVSGNNSTASTTGTSVLLSAQLIERWI
jgi:hypothetical protein